MEESFYRVECVNNVTDETQGGYMCAAMTMLSFVSGVVPSLDEDKILEAISHAKDPRMVELMSLLIELGDIPIPDVYADKKNNICLYKKEEFFEALDILAEMSNLLEEMTGGNYTLYYKSIDCLPEEIILYDDVYQVVIPREAYDSIKNDYSYNSLEFAIQILEERIEEDWY